jgi:murein DD-endopeptidase MepM/ murein hydrolase activator NlpD
MVPERPRIDLATTLADGEGIALMLQRAGVGAGDAARAAQLVAAIVPASEVAGGTRFAVVLGPRPAGGGARPLESLQFRARLDLAVAITRNGGALVLTRQPIAVDDTPLRIRGVAGESLYRSARAAGAPPRAVQQFLQALDAHFSLDGVAPGDRFDLILSYKRAAGGEVEEGQLLYAGLEHDGQPRAQLLRWGGEGQFFDAASLSGAAQTSGLIMPVAGHLTSSFGMRYHPILGYARMHSGIDFGAAYGSPIVAVADGLVTYAGVHGGHGNYVRLEHGGGVGTAYGHMSRIAVAPGTRVRAGQVIGYVGSTGLSTGPHLHYEVFRDGRPVDPGSVHFVVRAGVEPGQLARFKARLAQLLSVRPGAALAPLGRRLARAVVATHSAALR